MMSNGVAEDQERAQTAVKEALQLKTRSLPAPRIRRKNLFEDSLLETNRGSRRRRAWTTLFSLTVQCLLIGVLILVPLLYTQVLPKEQVVTLLVAPPPPPPPPPPAAPPTHMKEVRVASDIVNGQLLTPSRIPNKILMTKEAEAPPPALPGGVVGGVPGGIPGGQLGGVIGGMLSSISRPVAVPKLYKPVAVPQRVRVSQGVTRGLLIRQVQPTYPVLAREARIQGQVVLTAIIAKDGTIQKLQVVSGHPMLVPAAINAVKQWRYKPYLLNGQPAEVVTTITVNFSLGG
jgi:periplasmic protein TonB